MQAEVKLASFMKLEQHEAPGVQGRLATVKARLQVCVCLCRQIVALHIERCPLGSQEPGSSIAPSAHLSLQQVHGRLA